VKLSGILIDLASRERVLKDSDRKRGSVGQLLQSRVKETCSESRRTIELELGVLNTNFTAKKKRIPLQRSLRQSEFTNM